MENRWNSNGQYSQDSFITLGILAEIQNMMAECNTCQEVSIRMLFKSWTWLCEEVVRDSRQQAKMVNE